LDADGKNLVQDLGGARKRGGGAVSRDGINKSFEEKAKREGKYGAITTENLTDKRIMRKGQPKSRGKKIEKKKKKKFLKRRRPRCSVVREMGARSGKIGRGQALPNRTRRVETGGGGDGKKKIAMEKS